MKKTKKSETNPLNELFDLAIRLVQWLLNCGLDLLVKAVDRLVEKIAHQIAMIYKKLRRS